MLACPLTAGAATVSHYTADSLDDASVEVVDVGRHRNDLDVRLGASAFVVVEHGRKPLTARRGCRGRSSHVVVCRITDLTEVYVDTGGGDDRIRARCTPTVVELYGGTGNDYLVTRGCGASLYGGPGTDVLVGGPHVQELYGGGGDDRLFGGDGRDYLYGDGAARHRGDDFIDGGRGLDIAGWDERSDGIHADLSRGFARSRTDRDTLTRIEDLGGTAGHDVLIGDDGPNTLRGSDGRDLVIGRGGGDVLDGGSLSVQAADGDDEVRDRFRCGGGRDIVRYPESWALPLDCELMRDDYPLQFATLPVRPPVVAPHTVAVAIDCDHSAPSCTRQVVIRAGRKELGHSPVIADPQSPIRVRLTAAAPRDSVVSIVVRGDDEDSDVLAEGARIPFRYAWRVTCRGALKRDVCRAGG